MKKLYSLLTALVLTIAAGAQTLNVTLGNVTYQFPASQTGEMTYADGQTLTIMGKTFTLSDITSMTVDNSEAKANQVAVNYDGTSATVTVAGNVAQYVSATGGTAIFDGVAYTDATVTGGSSISLSSYTGGNGGPGGGPGGGGPGGGPGGRW